ncbi:hypothetical protein QJQ45_009558 [Haematococcus lacustris]|nr:hypothetical protein QJQ45_009558 [Haematococcus lacustris]
MLELPQQSSMQQGPVPVTLSPNSSQALPSSLPTQPPAAAANTGDVSSCPIIRSSQPDTQPAFSSQPAPLPPSAALAAAGAHSSSPQLQPCQQAGLPTTSGSPAGTSSSTPPPANSAAQPHTHVHAPSPGMPGQPGTMPHAGSSTQPLLSCPAGHTTLPADARQPPLPCSSLPTSPADAAAGSQHSTGGSSGEAPGSEEGELSEEAEQTNRLTRWPGPGPPGHAVRRARLSHEHCAGTSPAHHHAAAQPKARKHRPQLPGPGSWPSTGSGHTYDMDGAVGLHSPAGRPLRVGSGCVESMQLHHHIGSPIWDREREHGRNRDRDVLMAHDRERERDGGGRSRGLEQDTDRGRERGGGGIRGATARLSADRLTVKEKREGSGKEKKGPREKPEAFRSPQCKQRQARRDGWNTSRRQACKKTKRKLRAHLQLRAEVHSQLRAIASLFVLRLFLTCLPAPAQPASMESDSDYDSESDCESEPESQSDSESEPEPEPVTQPTPRRCSARLAALAPAAPSGPPVPLDCEDPVMLRQLKEFCEFYANTNFKTVYNQLQRRLVRPKQRRHPMLMPVFEDLSNKALLAKLQELGNINLIERVVKLYAKAARARLGWSGEEAQLFIKMACGYGINAQSSELQAVNLDKGHVADLIKEANKHRRLLGMKKQGSLVGLHFIKVDSRMLHGVCKQLGLARETEAAFTSEPALSHNWARWFNTNKLRNKEFDFERTVDTDGVSVCVHYTRPLPPPPTPPPAASSSSSRPSAAAAAAAHAVGLPHMGRGIAETHERSGQLIADQLAQWKLTKGQVKHDSGLNNARRDTERWLAPIKPHLQHLAAASSAGTSLEANLKHITVTLTTWDALEEDMAEVSMKRHGHAKQLVVFFGAAGIGTQGGWGADAVLRAQASGGAGWCLWMSTAPPGSAQQ